MFLKNMFLFFSQGPGGFRELREASRNHFHLSWYLSDYVVTSYDQKLFGWGDFFYHPRYIFGVRDMSSWQFIQF